MPVPRRVPASIVEKQKRGPRTTPVYLCPMCGTCHSTIRTVSPKRIRNLRIERGLTTTALASWAGISPQYVIDIEHGNRRMPAWLMPYYGLMPPLRRVK
jgi:DNA-binding XRE family transcriptional regulator